jgi:hypothetical protein
LFCSRKNVLIKNKCIYKLVIVSLKSYNSKNLIEETLNIHSLTLHFEGVFAYPNLLASHILCLNETRIRNVRLYSKIYNVLSQKFPMLPCYDEHGTMALYDDNLSLTKNTTITNFGVKFIIALFNDNTQETIYIIAIYKPLKMRVPHCNSIIENIIQKMPSHCLIVIIGDSILFLNKKKSIINITSIYE